MSGMIQYLRELHFASVVVRLALAMLLGGCIGLERGRKRRPAGFRTYMLVCLGAALTVLLSLFEFTMVTGPWSGICAEIGIKTDVSRFGAQVINGIGFLGAGTILAAQSTKKIIGLTTAASIWAVAAVGLAAGAGLLFMAGLTALLILITLRALRRIDRMLSRTRPHHFLELTLTVEAQHFPLERFRLYLRQNEFRPVSFESERAAPGRTVYRILLEEESEEEEGRLLLDMMAFPGMEQAASRKVTTEK